MEPSVTSLPRPSPPQPSLPRLSAPLPPGVAPPARPWALLVDFDACIAEATAAADGMAVSPASRYALISLFRSLGGAVALITNRNLLEVDRQLGLPDVPVVASNGLEMRSLRKSAAAPLFAAGAPSRRPRGELVSALMATAPFAGRAPVYLSGASGDSTAYTVAAALGGAGIVVGGAQPGAAASLPDARSARMLLRAWAADMTETGKPSSR